MRTTFLFLMVSFVNAFVPINKFSLKMISEKDISNLMKYKKTLEQLDYTKLNHLIDKKDLSQVFIDNKNNDIFTTDYMNPNNFHITHVEPYISESLIDKFIDKSIPLYFIENHTFNIGMVFNFLISSLNFIVPLVFIYIILNRMNTSPIQKKNDMLINPNISLSQWAGSSEIIEECKEVIDYIENKNMYEEMNALMPKGILLNGPPGTGKTLLAKAIATETKSSFISVSGSEFMEMYVGLGASRIRDLFTDARNNRPCIIFIDEIDAIGKKRGNNINGMNDEREQTLNQLLYEMDGFNDNTDIFIMGATNRKDILDDALLRPGRFDRIVTIPLPDKESRKQIIELYLQNKNYDSSVDIDSFADLTSGFSGAELNNIINEATILSIKNKDYIIKEEYLFEAFEKSIVGIIKKNSTILPEVSQRVALHETGHTIMVLLNEYMNFQKVSILPTYNGAGGYTLFTNKYDNLLYTKEELKKKLMVIMGGKAMEELFYGVNNVSLGCSQDLEDAKQLTTYMITKYGMGNKLKLYSQDYSEEESEQTKEDKYNEIQDLLNESYDNTLNSLIEYYDKAIEIHSLLLKKKSLTKKDIDLKN
jgi:cell division protease FtsH